MRDLRRDGSLLAPQGTRGRPTQRGLGDALEAGEALLQTPALYGFSRAACEAAIYSLSRFDFLHINENVPPASSLLAPLGQRASLYNYTLR